MHLQSWLSEAPSWDWETESSGTVQVALIGLGWWTVDIVLPALERTDRCEATVLVSRDGEKATRIARQHGVEHGLSADGYHDGTLADAYDAVYIATPNATHLPYAETAAELGKAVLCEKPIEGSVERADRMVTACDTAAVPFMAAYRMQTDPAVRRAREAIEAGVIGTPRYVTGTNAQRLLEMNPDPDQWRLSPDLAGYGTSVMDLGIYIINTARFLLGTDPISATARMESDHEAFAAVPDEWASFTLQHPNGVTVQGATSQRAQSTSSLTITGTEGQLRLDPAFHGEPTLHVTRGDVELTTSIDGYDGVGEMAAEFAYFADRISAAAPIEPDGPHAMTDMRAIRAIHRAAETGESVPVDTDR